MTVAHKYVGELALGPDARAALRSLQQGNCGARDLHEVRVFPLGEAIVCTDFKNEFYVIVSRRVRAHVVGVYNARLNSAEFSRATWYGPVQPFEPLLIRKATLDDEDELEDLELEYPEPLTAA